jgi:biotin synthase
MNKVLSGKNISFDEAEKLYSTDDTVTLCKCANIITKTFNGDRIDVETLINAKSGRCPEDCSFCAQSSFYETAISKYPLLPKDDILKQAKTAKENGASSFCLVCAYREPPERDFEQICDIISSLKQDLDIEINVSLGFMSQSRIKRLKELGIKRYNHNLEAAESYFSSICKTHDFSDRYETAKLVKEGGLELCCGGIIGMGETPKQRLELAFEISSLDPDEVPINILIAREGTPLEIQGKIEPLEIIKTIALWRFIIPRAIIKIAGGREIYFKDNGKLALAAGANGIITGGYLTTKGNLALQDMSMIKEIGLHS